MSAIRPAAIAGSFYPADPRVLAREIAGYLAEARPGIAPGEAIPKAIIAPHAGTIYSGPVAASAYARLAPARGRVERVVLIGPSHYVAFRGLAAGAASAWRTPLGRVPIDRAAIEQLVRAQLVGMRDAAHAREHSLEIHLPFLQTVLGEFRLVPIVAGDAAPEAVAALLDAVWGGPETLIVVSSDLSHYLDYRSCQAVDRETAAAIERLDLAALGPDQACGCVPVSGVLLAAKRRGMRIATLDLRNSGDTAGPRDRVVGYGSWALYEDAETAGARAKDDAAALAAHGATLLHLARGSIASGLANGRPQPIEATAGLPAMLTAHGAAFVTLKRGGELRGCIGSAFAYRPLAEDVVENAFAAAFRDPRFPPLERDEFNDLVLAVSVLTPPAPMQFADEANLLAQLRPGRDGLIIADGRRHALFLPAVWEHIPDPGEFLAQLRLKAGMAANHWSRAFSASCFEAIEFAEPQAAALAATRQFAGSAGTVTLGPPAG